MGRIWPFAVIFALGCGLIPAGGRIDHQGFLISAELLALVLIVVVRLFSGRD